MATKSTTSAAGSGASVFTLKNLSLLIVVLMLAISAYLAYVQATETQALCLEGSSFDCAAVSASEWAYLPPGNGISVAYLGFFTNIVLLGMLLLEDRIPFLQDNGIVLFFSLVLFGFLFSMWLVYVQAVMLESYCQWCLIHEALMAVLLVVSGLRLRADWQD